MHKLPLDYYAENFSRLVTCSNWILQMWSKGPNEVPLGGGAREDPLGGYLGVQESKIFMGDLCGKI